MHRHYWTIDGHNHGECACGASRDFPREVELDWAQPIPASFYKDWKVRVAQADFVASELGTKGSISHPNAVSIFPHSAFGGPAHE